MVSAPIIAKTLGGIGAVGTVSSGGYYYRDAIKEYINSKPVSFIVKAVNAKTDFLTSNRCFSSQSKKENAYCELKAASIGDDRFFDLLKINKSKGWTTVKEDTKHSITSDSFYKLTIDTARFDTKIIHDTTEVFIKSSTTENDFAQFKIVATLGKEPIASNTYLLVEATKVASHSEGITVTDDNSKCKLDEKGDAVKCIVYKFTPDLTDLNAITFKQKGAKATDVKVTQNHFFVVDFTGVDASKKIKSSTITWLKENDTDTAKHTTFTVKSVLVGKFDFTTDGKNEIFVLKNMPSKTKAPAAPK